jgi:hypothetical protein
MDNESKETRRPWFLIVGGLISIVCSFTSLESAYSQNSPNRHSPPPQTYWFFPGDTPNYFHGVYGQFGSFAGLIGPAVNTGFNTTVDLMHGALEVTDAYVFGGHLGARIVPASDFSPLMAQYDRMVKCEGQEVADQTYTTSNVINGLVTEAVGAAQHSLTVDGSTALMDWWANFSGGTLGGAIATAPIGALPWGRPLSPAVRPPPIRRPPIVVVPVTEVFINGKWVPVGGSAPTTALLPRPAPILLPHRSRPLMRPFDGPVKLEPLQQWLATYAGKALEPLTLEQAQSLITACDGLDLKGPGRSGFVVPLKDVFTPYKGEPKYYELQVSVVPRGPYQAALASGKPMPDGTFTDRIVAGPAGGRPGLGHSFVLRPEAALWIDPNRLGLVQPWKNLKKKLPPSP